MTVHIRSIATAVPSAILQQDKARDLFAAQPGLTRLGQRLVNTAFDNAAVSTRHTVIDELVVDGPTIDGSVSDGPVLGGPEAVFYEATSGRILNPLTGVRNEVYTARAPELFITAARSAIEQSGGLTASEVTHVITVSCTGFVAPGPDLWVVQGLGLSPSTQRFHLGFMGCYGAFPGLRAATAFCRADPSAVVLVVCAELCTLHLHSSNVPDTIVSSSVFSDGAAACVVTARTDVSPTTENGSAPTGSRASHPILEINRLSTVVTKTGATDMAWSIGDNGFEMVLSNYVPHIIEENIAEALLPLFGEAESASAGGSTDRVSTVAEVAEWAIHPGGRGILDRVQTALALSAKQLEASRAVLRDYGNMSSATVLFILRDLLATGAAGTQPSSTIAGPAAQRICAMAFGPGLTVESALLTRSSLRP